MRIYHVLVFAILPITLLVLATSSSYAAAVFYAYSPADISTHIDPNKLNPQNAGTKLPNSVEQILKKEPRLKECFYGGEYTQAGDMNQFFDVPVQLQSTRDDGLIVAPGSIECGMGADINTFWVFRRQGMRYRLVLKTFAYSLDILKKKLSGYHLIGIVAHTAIKEWQVIYRFNGKRYVPGACFQRTWGPRRDSVGNFVPTPWREIHCSGSDVKPYR